MDLLNKNGLSRALTDGQEEFRTKNKLRVARSGGFSSRNGLSTRWARASHLFKSGSSKRFQASTCAGAENAECNAPPTRLRDASRGLQNLRELCVLGRHSLFSSGSHAELSGEVCSVVNFPFRVHSRLLHQPLHLQCGPVVPLRLAAPMF